MPSTAIIPGRRKINVHSFTLLLTTKQLCSVLEHYTAPGILMFMRILYIRE